MSLVPLEYLVSAHEQGTSGNLQKDQLLDRRGAKVQ